MTNNSNEPLSRSAPCEAPHAPRARFGAAVLALSGLALLAGCAAPGPAGPSARAELLSRSGSSVTGAVDFVQRGNVLVVTGEIRGLKPNAEHGFHVHEKGDCSAADATSAGGHFAGLFVDRCPAPALEWVTVRDVRGGLGTGVWVIRGGSDLRVQGLTVEDVDGNALSLDAGTTNDPAAAACVGATLPTPCA